MPDKKRLLLHICCAPDAVYSLPFLRREYDVTGYFYNPNIHPEEEYYKRLDEVRKLSSLQRYELLEGPYDSDQWSDLIRGLENMGEYSERCRICIENSLFKTAVKAKELGMDLFATTLTNSPRKSIDLLDEVGEAAGKEAGIPYLRTNLKKKDGYLKSTKMCRVLDIYRQNYCGCVFSKRDAAKKKKVLL